MKCGDGNSHLPKTKAHPTIRTVSYMEKIYTKDEILAEREKDLEEKEVLWQNLAKEANI